MNRPSSTIASQHQQQEHCKQSQKAENGLLSRLFGSLRRSQGSRPRAAHLACSAAPVCDQILQTASSSTKPVNRDGGPAASECNASVPVFNYQTNIESKYEFRKELGSGGNGVVRLAVRIETGEEFAVKSIKKILPADASAKKKLGHLDSIRREVLVLTKLNGSLNTVKLEDVYEDDECVHIVMELCKGGELWHRIGDRHYSERTVASFMRAGLRTLAQCHAQNILHRDIKPGNFMLLSDDERAPVKAIDFGLAAPFEPGQLPRTDLGLEGTPWYMAPETLRGEWLPASDMWAAGVMAYQLLCGRFPFDDKKNSFAPAITAIWRSVLNDPLDFNQSAWSGISEEAKDFCRLLLHRDVAARPTAKEALKHPWLRGDSSERSVGKRLSQSVVARIQRFASGSLLKRSVLQFIAAELLSQPQLLRAEDRERVVTSESGRPIVAAPDAACLQPLLAQLRLEGCGAVVGEEQLGEGLAKMGFKLAPSEVSRLMEQVDVAGSGAIDRAAFAASQMDWRHLQRNHTELWLELAAKAFRSLDADGSGVLEVEELLRALRARLPPEEVQAALGLALQEAAGGAAGPAGSGEIAVRGGGGGGPGGLANGIDFEGFMTLLKVGSLDSLDLYDDRMSIRSGGSSLDRYNALLAGAASASASASASLLAASLRDGSRHGPGNSRHGPGGSRHRRNGSRHGPGGSRHGGVHSADTSAHSHASDRSDLAALQDNDRSTHGFWGGAAAGHLHPHHTAMPPAAPVPIGGASTASGIVFRFGVDNRNDSSGHKRGHKSAAGGSSGSDAPAGGGLMAWRFDVGGPKEDSAGMRAAAAAEKAAAAAAGTPAWRFDVGGERGGGGRLRESGEPAAAGHSAAGAGAGGGQAAAGKEGYAAVLGRQGGYFDRRMHGSDLYRNVALRALQAASTGVGGGHHRPQLDTVAE